MSNYNSIDFKLSNIVMGIEFNAIFNIHNLFDLLPCYYIPKYLYENEKKIPFFGIPNCIVTIQSEREAIGIRNSKAIKNSTSIDFQNSNKNVHIKITGKKFHISGVQSVEMGKETAQTCLDFIYQIDKKWINFFSLPPDFREELAEKAIEVLFYDDETLLMFDSDLANERLNKISENREIIFQLISFSYFYFTPEKFKEKMKKILNIIPSGTSLFFSNFSSECKVENKPEIIKTKIYNSIYNYKFPFMFLFSELSVELEKRGYMVDYRNVVKGNKMSIVVGITTEEKTKKVPAHRFHLNKKGSVRQTSPVEREKALAVFEELRDIIFEINDKNEKNNF